jgi:hypothetical protein
MPWFSMAITNTFLIEKTPASLAPARAERSTGPMRLCAAEHPQVSVLSVTHRASCARRVDRMIMTTRA